MHRERWMEPLAWGFFALSLLLQILTWRAFYGDGAAFFVNGLLRGSISLWPAHRAFTTALYQAPFWAGLQLGITDLDWLQALFAIGLFAPWPLALWFCWRLAPDQLWLPLAACGLGYLNSCLLAFSNALAAHALVWPVLIALVFVRPLSRFAAATLVGAALLLLRSYESQILLGPLLAAVAFWRLRQREGRLARTSLAVSGLLLLGSAWLALAGIRATPISGNRDQYLRTSLTLLSAPSWTLAFSLALVVATVLLLWRPRLQQLAERWWAQALLLLLLAVWGMGPLLAPGLFQPDDQYAARGLNLAVPVLLLPVAFLARRHAAWFDSRRRWLYGAALALLLAQSLWQISATVQWQGYVGAVRVLLAQRQGPVRVEGSPLDRPRNGNQVLRFRINWTLPYLSLLLAPDGQVRTLLWAQSTFQPVDPQNAESIPDLSRYGFRLDAYRRLLRALHTTTGEAGGGAADQRRPPSRAAGAPVARRSDSTQSLTPPGAHEAAPG